MEHCTSVHCMVLLEVFRKEFGLDAEPEEKTSDFLTSISTEMKLEE
jgi:hypothetical protein